MRFQFRILEGRWLHSKDVLDSYSRFWFTEYGSHASGYSFWPADSMLARSMVTGTCWVVNSSMTVLYYTILYCTVLYCSVLYCTVLYCTVLYCTVLYCTVLYCTVLFCTVLYWTVLFCTVLYYTELN